MTPTLRPASGGDAVIAELRAMLAAEHAEFLWAALESAGLLSTEPCSVHLPRLSVSEPDALGRLAEIAEHREARDMAWSRYLALRSRIRAAPPNEREDLVHQAVALGVAWDFAPQDERAAIVEAPENEVPCPLRTPGGHDLCARCGMTSYRYDCIPLLRERLEAALAILAHVDDLSRIIGHGCMECAAGPVDNERDWEHVDDCPMKAALAWRGP